MRLTTRTFVSPSLHALSIGIGLAVLGCLPTSSPSSQGDQVGSSQNQIVGGTETGIGEYPWAVAVKNPGSSTIRCGGVLIHPEYVLTVAHCVAGASPGAIELVLGEHDLTTTTESNEITVAAAEIAIHPNYNSSTNDNDIALVRLQPDADTNAYFARPSGACALQLPQASEQFVNETATVVGWGSAAFGGTTSNVLQEAALEILSNAEANVVYGGITSNMLAARGSSQTAAGSCDGDSGAPLTVVTSSGPTLTGLASFGIGCGNPSFPDIFTRVSPYLGWLDANLSSARPACPVDVDDDGDGVANDGDNCPDDANPGQENLDEDSAGDVCDDFPGDSSETVDSDGDGVGDNADVFPDDPNETGDEDGDGVGDNNDACFGFPNVDTDGDKTCDNSDPCKNDPLDEDADSDGICDVEDSCIGGDPTADADGDQVCDAADVCTGNDAAGDTDGDGYCDDKDNCPEDANPSQYDGDGDEVGDACDDDGDVDGVPDGSDNCPDDSNPDQSDIDDDGVGDVCDGDDDGDNVADEADNCPFYANANQADSDGDGAGDLCDGDDDGDGVADDGDSCPGTPIGAPFDSLGCSGPQRIELKCGVPADYGWRHGHYVRCVTRQSRAAWRMGLITAQQRARLIRRAAHAAWHFYIQRVRRWC